MISSRARAARWTGRNLEVLYPVEAASLPIELESITIRQADCPLAGFAGTRRIGRDIVLAEGHLARDPIQLDL